jgi:hypothetical protein
MTLTGKAILLFALCVAGTFGAEPALTPEILTNEGIVALANAGFSDSFIVEKILLSNRTRLDVSVEGLAYLRRNAISENLALFLIEHNAQPLMFTPAAPLVSPVTPVMGTAKVKMKKIKVPADAVNVTFEHAGVAPVATFANPVMAQPRLSRYTPQVKPVAASWWR